MRSGASNSITQATIRKGKTASRLLFFGLVGGISFGFMTNILAFIFAFDSYSSNGTGLVWGLMIYAPLGALTGLILASVAALAVALSGPNPVSILRLGLTVIVAGSVAGMMIVPAIWSQGITLLPPWVSVIIGLSTGPTAWLVTKGNLRPLPISGDIDVLIADMKSRKLTILNRPLLMLGSILIGAIVGVAWVIFGYLLPAFKLFSKHPQYLDPSSYAAVYVIAGICVGGFYAATSSAAFIGLRSLPAFSKLPGWVDYPVALLSTLATTSLFVSVLLHNEPTVNP
jgi:hypothetical protein